ncbi:hypothetical protein ACEZDG_33955 [Streptacidiphilus sp. N1-1]|uniref:GNAT family N-acetyltransferase n=1 Tax=Streptacidiphilus alkalitolerans TaxID=3342712 RepID=A0ABV6VKL7_9ACTN
MSIAEPEALWIDLDTERRANSRIHDFRRRVLAKSLPIDWGGISQMVRDHEEAGLFVLGAECAAPLRGSYVGILDLDRVVPDEIGLLPVGSFAG